MRLTNTIREAFIQAALDDVPQVDHVEAARSAVMAEAVKRLPVTVAKVWNDPTTRDYIETRHMWISTAGMHLPILDSYDEKLRADFEKVAKPFVDQHHAQQQMLTALREKLGGVAYAVSTRKALADALPEFAKYLPPEVETSRMVPVIANVVTEFVKAGWPKGSAA
jgi:hypothetical protein